MSIDASPHAEVFPASHEFSEEEIRALVATIEQSGYAVIPRFIGATDLVELRKFVREAVSRAGGKYVVLKGYEPVADTALGAMARSPSLKRLCVRAYEQLTSRAGPDSDYYQILRCLTGDVGVRNSMIFHFDTYVLTLLLPIEVPAGQNSGELLVLPNVRKIRRWYMGNLLDKILLDNALSQWMLRAMARRRPQGFVRIALEPGHLYLFWGYRSIHTNAPCDVDKIRATALLHYADPHSDSALKKFLGREMY